jgi:hypothetical protein
METGVFNVTIRNVLANSAYKNYMPRRHMGEVQV